MFVSILEAHQLNNYPLKTEGWVATYSQKVYLCFYYVVKHIRKLSEMKDKESLLGSASDFTCDLLPLGGAISVIKPRITHLELLQKNPIKPNPALL